MEDNLPIEDSIMPELQEKIKQDKDRRFDNLQKKIVALRKEAIDAMRRSRIRDIMYEDIEYYEGVDDYNRSNANYIKPYYDGPLLDKTAIASNQCTAFFNITRQFVDSAAARAGDILLPMGGWNWGIKKTPISEDVSEEKTFLDQAQEDVNAQKTKLGEERIKDWLVESRYHREYRKAIEWAAKVGTGIIRGPYPELQRSFAMMDGAMVAKEEIVPSVKSISPFDFYPDMNCRDDIHNGEFVFERDRLTYKQISDLLDDPSYLKDALLKVLKEGPKGAYLEDNSNKKESDVFELWIFTGNINVHDEDLIDPEVEKEYEYEVNENGLELCECKDEPEYKSAVIVMVNDTIIKSHMNPLPKGSFPYRVLQWQRRDDSPFGIGVARQGRVAQQLLLSSARNLVDNMGLSAMPMIAIRRSGITPADGNWELAKGKVWWLTDEAIRNINEAIQAVAIPSLQAELQEIMVLAGKMFEDATGVNSLLQGQQGSAPDTVGGMELLHKNASALLRRIGRISDEEVTEPLIKDFYDWLLMYGEDSEKGDFEIEAFGSSILVEREIQEMQAQTLLQYAADPSYGLSKSKIMGKIVEAWGFEPTDVMMDDQEKQQLAQQSQQQQPDPRLAAAQLNSETQLQIAQLRAQVEQARIQKDVDRDTVYVQSQNERDASQQQYLLNKLEIDRQLKMLEYALQEKISLEKVKADLSKKAMDIQSTKELAGMEASANRLPTPPVEPPGTAQPGHSFTQ